MQYQSKVLALGFAPDDGRYLTERLQTSSIEVAFASGDMNTIVLGLHEKPNLVIVIDVDSVVTYAPRLISHLKAIGVIEQTTALIACGNFLMSGLVAQLEAAGCETIRRSTAQTCIADICTKVINLHDNLDRVL